MSILAIDYGRRRMGLAISQSCQLARPAGFLMRKTLQDDLAALAQLVESQEVTAIVLGLPWNMDGSEGEIAKEARRFGEYLRNHLQRPIYFWDERLTSWDADNTMREVNLPWKKRDQQRDARAAALILQNYLDYRVDSTKGPE